VVTLPSPTAAIEEQARAFGLGKLDSNSTCTYYYRAHWLHGVERERIAVALIRMQDA
jgi:hypothetical protein